MDILIDDLVKQQNIDGQDLNIPGYFVCSTAPIDIENDEQQVDEKLPTIYDVVEHLYQNSKSFSKEQKEQGVVIQIHGYNTGIPKNQPDDVRQDWEIICKYINQKDNAIKCKKNSFIYIGYRWPSESVPSDFRHAVNALPFLLKILFIFGLSITIIGIISVIKFSFSLIWVLILIGVFLTSLVVTLFILRIIVYFRDSYRATNFAIPDLVEFIRQLDQGLIKRKTNEPLFEEIKNSVIKSSNSVIKSSNIEPLLLTTAIRKTWEILEKNHEVLKDKDSQRFKALIDKIKQRELNKVDDIIFQQIFLEFVKDAEQKNKNNENANQAALEYWDKKRIKLTFIGHSMGGFVTTQVVRILSDVFDPKAIGNVESLEKRPSSSIGRVFCLGRLILVSPDIPVNAILSRRSNFLRSCLRRFEEAYLFSNEGDVALRLASTTANYFSFPACTRVQGYRLGNVTVNLPGEDKYGIVNLEKLLSSEISSEKQKLLSGEHVDHLLQYIGIKVLNQREQRNLIDPIRDKKDPESLVTNEKDPESIADLFTYFDCTEYQDKTDYTNREDQTMNVLICNGQKSPLTLLHYIQLLKAYVDFFKKNPQGIDVHGGYFYGHFSKLIIYRLAFLGFQGLLDSILLESSSEFNLEPPPGQLQQQLDKKEELSLVDRRKVALEYFSWLCEKKFIQIAASSERYRVDVLDETQQQVRTEILSIEQR